ncbi:creatininase family protein [Kaarinaea lacus]
MQDYIGVRVEEITWEVFAEYLKVSSLSVLPIAASCKEHGLHLPMNADAVQAYWITEQLLKSYELIVWPTIGYGYYPAFINYPGSISVTDETFIKFVAEVCQSIFSHEIAHLIILNTGISTISPLRSLIEKYEFDGELHLWNLYQGRQFRAIEQQISQQVTGGHADEIETSIMLAMAPEQVDMKKAESGLSAGATRGVLQKSDPESGNYSISGAIGDPTLATREKGELFLKAMLQDLEDYISDIRKRVG